MTALSLDRPRSTRRSSPLRQLWRAFSSEPRALVGLAIFTAFVLMALLAPFLAHYNPESTRFAQLAPPSARHWLGTTGSGQDVFAQWVMGSRVSLTVGMGAGLLMTVLAILLGMLPAYIGGKTDTVFATLANVMLVIPGLPLLVVIAAYVHSAGPLTIALVIGGTGWAWGARVLRSQTLTLAHREFVTAARMAGLSQIRILLTEILPNMLSLVVANFMFASLAGILSEAGIEFLGLGNPNIVTWGTMLYWAQVNQALLNGAWWWLVPPGLSIALLGMSFALMNFGIDRVTNPRLRQRAKAPDKRSGKREVAMHA